MSFLFAQLSPDIERTIVQNVQYRDNMNSVMRELSRGAEGTENECNGEYGGDITMSGRFEIFIEILDISWNIFTNEAIFECDSEYYNNQ